MVIAEWPVQFLVPASPLEVEAIAEAIRTELEDAHLGHNCGTSRSDCVADREIERPQSYFAIP